MTTRYFTEKLKINAPNIYSLLLTKVDRETLRAVEDIINILTVALRNPKNIEIGKNFEAKLTKIVSNTENKQGLENRKIFEALEQEMRNIRLGKQSNYDIKKSEANGFFAYTSAGNYETKIKGLIHLREDIKKAEQAFENLDSKIEKINEYKLEKILDLIKKDEIKKQDIQNLFGKDFDPVVVQALFELLHRSEAASIAAQNILKISKEEYEKIFGISAKNEMIALLNLYKKMRGSKEFEKIKQALMQGRFVVLSAEIRKMSFLLQYLFFSLLVLALMRSGMWNKEILNMLGEMLKLIRMRSLELGLDPNRSQMEYLFQAKEFISKFADFKALNLSMFSTVFISSLNNPLNQEKTKSLSE